MVVLGAWQVERDGSADLGRARLDGDGCQICQRWDWNELTDSAIDLGKAGEALKMC